MTLDRVMRHTVVHHSSTSTYIPNFIGIGKTFCGRTDGHLRPTSLGRLFGVDLKSQQALAINLKDRLPNSMEHHGRSISRMQSVAGLQ